MNRGGSDISVGGLALGFGAGALFIILLTWLGGGMFHGGGMMGGGGMFADGVVGAFGAMIGLVLVAAILGAIIAVVHNAFGRK